ncbi:TIGR04283 family arsenosugar biosynthesis glycosyltransferase [Methylomonas sp. SURF-1]|uniref:TIGR04283 family arsenosugar biosynthesis glycosyltransferase n=1 Tax=Methylomonas aurea TaxID=2952224 RepID=A0ABT1UM73_9GAMM|nr:TIGR04283 family arsenosugar biosynthesis glycosyltransferase [Methylomonas sp. SURF-1]MCQ8183339.1 TIGR04283 family arsenosugar biosynthesis glycosyltransferase [Methylomonas sp. SURF-1]
MRPSISIVIPVLNEAGQIAVQLQALQALREQCQLIVVDGGSDDGSTVLAAPLADKLLHGPRGRAKQMNLGAAEADGECLLFLHVDTRLPADAVTVIHQVVAEGYRWGRFDVAFDSPQPVFKLIALMMNWRSRLTGIATGDQALFVTRQAFAEVGGFPDIALMEDIAISAKLKKLGRPCCIGSRVVTSARRWQQYGVLPTILLMWRLRLAYFFGADPNDLALRYYGRS